MNEFTNFIPSTKGKFTKLPGFKHVRWGHKTLLVRLKMWWNGDPLAVNQMLAHGGDLFVATDRGLYVMHGDVLKPVPYMVETK